MQKSPLFFSFSLLTTLMAVTALPGAHAQGTAATPHQPAAPTQPPTKVANPDALLANAARLYYSYSRIGNGLDGFDCAVHPDWKKIVIVASKGASDAPTEQHIQLLNGVKLQLHAQLMGRSTLDWDESSNVGKTFDEDSLTLLTSMHQATEQTLQGFLQFWAPFMNGSVVPSSSPGLDITQSARGYKLVAVQGDTSVTERFDPKLVLQEFDVAMSGAAMSFSPSYKATKEGLLVTSFTAHIRPPESASAKSQEMHVSIEYETVDGFSIPARLSMDVVNTGTFDFVFDGCKVNQGPK